MLTTSKKWAAVLGFVIVAGAAMLEVTRSTFRPDVLASSGATRDAPAGNVAAQLAKAEPAPGVERKLVSENNTASNPKLAMEAGTAAAVPHFDVVRVEPSGDAVVAGSAAPDATVALLGNDEVLAETRTDASGHFALLPPPLHAGDHALTLRESVGGGTPVVSAQSVAVAVPNGSRGPVVVALAEPGSATRLLSPLPEPATPFASAAVGGAVASARSEAVKDQPLVVRSVELENGNGLYATGAAPPGAVLRLYLNEAPLADVVAAADGQWSVKIRQGLTGGHYVVRADGSADGRTITARAEVPFDVPATMAIAAPNRGARPQDLPAQPLVTSTAPRVTGARRPTDTGSADSSAVVEQVSTAAVQDGDTLWDISRMRLGQGRRYTRIYAANAAQIRDPRLIYPGQVLVLPMAIEGSR